jgi:hypothetical protein
MRPKRTFVSTIATAYRRDSSFNWKNKKAVINTSSSGLPSIRQESDVSDRTRPCRRATAGDQTTGDAVRGFVSVAAAVPARSLTSSGPGIIQRTVQAKPLPTGGRGRGISWNQAYSFQPLSWEVGRSQEIRPCLDAKFGGQILHSKCHVTL